MRGFHNNSFNPQTLVVLETAFDEAWLTLKSIGNTTVKRMSWRGVSCGLLWKANATRYDCTTMRSNA
jgi:hypothetical protein